MLRGGERGVRGGCWQGRRLSRWQLGGLRFHIVEVKVDIEVEVKVEAEVKLKIVGFVLLGKTSIFLSKVLLDALGDIEVSCGLECTAKRKVECGIFLARTKGLAITTMHFPIHSGSFLAVYSLSGYGLLYSCYVLSNFPVASG
jgi:hypothetical protein